MNAFIYNNSDNNKPNKRDKHKDLLKDACAQKDPSRIEKALKGREGLAMEKVQVDADDTGNTIIAYPLSFLIMGGASDAQVKHVVDLMWPTALGDGGDDYSTLPLALACQRFVDTPTRPNNANIMDRVNLPEGLDLPEGVEGLDFEDFEGLVLLEGVEGMDFEDFEDVDEDFDDVDDFDEGAHAFGVPGLATLRSNSTIELLIERFPLATWCGETLPIQYYLEGASPPDLDLVKLFVQANPKCINAHSIGLALQNESCPADVLEYLLDKFIPDGSTSLVLGKNPYCGGEDDDHLARPQTFITSQKICLLADTVLLPYVKKFSCDVGSFDLDAFSTFLRIMADGSSHVQHLHLKIPGGRNGVFYRYCLQNFICQNSTAKTLRIEGESVNNMNSDDEALFLKVFKANATLESLYLNDKEIV